MTRDTKELRLLEAQMHAECLNESWCDLCGVSGEKTPEEKRLLSEEISVRVWAVIYLIQHLDDSEFSDEVQSVINEANSYNGPAEEFEGENKRMGMN